MIFKKIVGIVIFVSIYVILTLLKLNIYIQIPILYLILIFTYNEKTQRVLIVIIWTLFNSILQIILKNINLYLLYIPLFEYIIIDIIFDKARRIYDKYKKI